MYCGEKLKLYLSNSQKIYVRKLQQACLFVFRQTYKQIKSLKEQKLPITITCIKDYIQLYLVNRYLNLNKYPIEFLFQAGFRSLDVIDDKDFLKKEKNLNIHISCSHCKSFQIIDNKHLVLDGIGKVTVRGFRNNFIKIKHIVIKISGDDFFISFLIEFEPNKIKLGDKSLGLDLGTNPLITRSDGVKYFLPDNIINTEMRIQKLLKSKKSKSKESQYLKLKKKNHQRIVTYIQQITYEIIKSSDKIYIESIDVSEEVKKKPFLLKYCWGEIQKQLAYKSKWYGRTLIFIDRNYPSSQICSNCGFRNTKMKDLSNRVMDCDNCHCKIDRDVNAAINIKLEGERILFNNK